MKHIYFILMLFFLSACSKPADEVSGLSGNHAYGITILPQTPEIIMSRGDETAVIENVLVFIMDEYGNLLKFRTWDDWFEEYEEEYWVLCSEGSLSFPDVVIPKEAVKAVALCNVSSSKYSYFEKNSMSDYGMIPQTAFDDFIKDCIKMEEESLLSGWHDNMLTGTVDLSAAEDISLLSIPVKRTMSLCEFDIRFEPVIVGEKFTIKKMTLFNIPRYTNVLPTPDMDTQLNTNDCAILYNKSYWIRELDIPVFFGKFSLYLPENRPGGVEDKEEYWPWIAHYPENEKKYYKQMFKRKIYLDRMVGKRDLMPTYLLITGTYTRILNNGEPFEFDLNYYIYLGADNYKDFNVKRNKHYIYNITIRKFDEIDSRVEVVGKE